MNRGERQLDVEVIRRAGNMFEMLATLSPAAPAAPLVPTAVGLLLADGADLAIERRIEEAFVVGYLCGREQLPRTRARRGKPGTAGRKASRVIEGGRPPA